MLDIQNEFTAIGANRHVNSADWDSHHEILAFGGGMLVNLWKPLVRLNIESIEPIIIL